MTSQPSQPGPARGRPGSGPRGWIAGYGPILGVVTALVALGVAQIVAAFIDSQLGGPVNAVGALSINHSPEAVKNFAIREFGSNDKTVLVWGIRAVLIIFAAVIGILALRKLWHGLAGLAVFVGIGVYAAESQPSATAKDVLPTLIGGAAAALFMWGASRLAGRGSAWRDDGWQPARPAGRQADDWPDVAPSRRPDAGLPEVSPRGLPATRAGPASEDPPGPAESPDWQGWQAPARQPPAGAEPVAHDGQQGLPPPAEPVVPNWQPAADRPPAEAVPSWQAWAQQPGQPGPPGRPGLPGPQGPLRPAGVPPSTPDRRKFLLVSAGAGVAGVVAYVGGTWLANARNVTDIQKATFKLLPSAATPAPPLPRGYDLKIPGLSSFITPNSNFYRVDTAIVLPEIVPATWSLRIHGMVQREVTLSFDQLIKRPMIEDYITLCCVSNPVGGPYVGNAKWLGVSLRRLLQEAGIKAGADQLLCTSADGFTSGTPVQTAMDGRDALLAVAMNDTALPVAHGFPVRLVIPGLYGYVSACKWITDIEVTTYAANVSYWAQRGWSAQAPVKTESRIDVPTLGATIKAGQPTAIAGVAWAQHKGIDAVEVRIDNGQWQQARLSAVPDIDTWRQWVYYWDANVQPGNHLIEARATDKTGYTQTSLQEPEVPNGASGYPSVQVTVSS